MDENLSILEKELRKILKENNKYWNNDKINRSAVINDLKEYNKELINNLINNELIAKNYVLDINGIKVLKIDELISFLRYKKYWQDSYTKYSNKIGLTVDDKFIDYNDDVILDFPFKDCVLEGGMSKDDIGKDEIFYNKVIARDEIDTLLSPKILTNVKKYDNDGSKIIDSINEEDNLILKGNNLIALSCLLERYRGKVKCIYIDPPYNTGKDSFGYNDNFNHSTWLTFMRNRLMLAKELLSETGVIFVSLDDKEAHYCKVLMDEVFERENFVADICHKARASVSNDKIISVSHNHLLFYGKNERKLYQERARFGIEKDTSTFNLKDDRGYYKLVPVDGPGGAKKGNPFYEFLDIEGYWRFSRETMQQMYDEGLVVRVGNSLQQKYYKSKAEGSRQTITTWWDEGLLTSSASSQLSRHLDLEFSNPKNEALIELILEFATQPGDLVMDFFLGSGTTTAVAHKMGRRYIGIEQMDYVRDVPVPRLQKVIEGEQSGISKEVNWQGGGSFIYAELMEYNNVFIDKIIKATSTDELRNIWNELAKKADLNYKLELKEFEKDLFGKEDNEFNSLTLQEQKEIFIDTLDLNQLYVNYSEIDDEELNISEEVKKFNKSFYNGDDYE